MEEEAKCDCPAGAPMWIVTFSDLMSLMLTFFVLLLSFSELDAQKFKKASGSIRLAFGVQREMVREQIPLGISIVAEEYSSGKPTVLDFDLPSFVTTDTYALQRRQMVMLMEDMKELFERNKAIVEQQLKEEIQNGSVKIQRDQFNLRITLNENRAFLANTDKIKRDFVATLKKTAAAIKQAKGKIRIHTYVGKNFQKSSFFRNSWELSAGQSAALVNVLAKFTGMSHERFEVRGHGQDGGRSRSVIEIGVDPKVMKEFGY